MALAHRALTDPDKAFSMRLLCSVNLSDLENEIITKSEINGINLETICNGLQHWYKKNMCSYSHCAKIKRGGMLKIGEYVSVQRV